MHVCVCWERTCIIVYVCVCVDNQQPNECLCVRLYIYVRAFVYVCVAMC